MWRPSTSSATPCWRSPRDPAHAVRRQGDPGRHPGALPALSGGAHRCTAHLPPCFRDLTGLYVWFGFASRHVARRRGTGAATLPPAVPPPAGGRSIIAPSTSDRAPGKQRGRMGALWMMASPNARPLQVVRGGATHSDRYRQSHLLAIASSPAPASLTREFMCALLPHQQMLSAPRTCLPGHSGW